MFNRLPVKFIKGFSSFFFIQTDNNNNEYEIGELRNESQLGCYLWKKKIIVISKWFPQYYICYWNWLLCSSCYCWYCFFTSLYYWLCISPLIRSYRFSYTAKYASSSNSECFKWTNQLWKKIRAHNTYEIDENLSQSLALPGINSTIFLVSISIYSRWWIDLFD